GVEALSHFNNAGSRGSVSLPVAVSRDAQRRIARERVPTGCTFLGRATPDRAGARPYRLQFLGTRNAGSRGSASLPVAPSWDAQRRIARERVPTGCTFSGRATPGRAGARPYRLHFLGTRNAGSRGSASHKHIAKCLGPSASVSIVFGV